MDSRALVKGFKSGVGMIRRQDLNFFLNELLAIEQFEDYGPNGLQVEGRETIHRLAFAVSASREAIEAAVELKADALVVHHGLFWSAQGPRPLVGPLMHRVGPLIRHEISLFAYHLPLDAHPIHGNAAVLGRALGLQALKPFGDYRGQAVGVQGVLPSASRVVDLQDQLAGLLHHQVCLASREPDARVSSVGIITGGASSGWRQALDAGLDVYITGEMSEHDWHDSREAGIHLFAGGHTATEVFGVQSLKALLETRFGLEGSFIDSQNPL